MCTTCHLKDLAYYVDIMHFLVPTDELITHISEKVDLINVALKTWTQMFRYTSKPQKSLTLSFLKKMSEFYPNAFKSWFKKYLEKNLKLAKKAKVEEADINVHSTIKDSVFSMKETDGEAFKTILSLASESDLILNGKGEFFSLSKLLGEAMNAQTLSKIK